MKTKKRVLTEEVQRLPVFNIDSDTRNDTIWYHVTYCLQDGRYITLTHSKKAKDVDGMTVLSHYRIWDPIKERFNNDHLKAYTDKIARNSKYASKFVFNK